MATIGSFKKSENGDYAGAVKTLTLNVKARITPVENTNDKAPDFRIYAGRTEIEFGAAWKKTSNEGRDYLSVKLDDPSFPSPIYASLVEVEGEDGLSLIWSRRNGDWAHQHRDAPLAPAGRSHDHHTKVDRCAEFAASFARTFPILSPTAPCNHRILSALERSSSGGVMG